MCLKTEVDVVVEYIYPNMVPSVMFNFWLIHIMLHDIDFTQQNNNYILEYFKISMSLFVGLTSMFH